MQSPYHEIWEQLTAFFVKFISVPALIAIFLKIAVQVRKKQATFIGVIVSLFTGLGMAYICQTKINELFSGDGNRTLAIAFVAIMSDKIMEYFIMKANVDKVFDEIGKGIIDKIKSLFKK